MRKILVTGGCGFLGSEVCKQLLQKGYEVTVADDLSKPGSSIKPGYTFFKIDLRDYKKTDSLFKKGNFDACINLAARVGGVGYLDGLPATILSDNNLIYSSTFEAAAKHNIRRMIFISSAMALNREELFSNLSDSKRKASIYGLSKIIGENYCHAFLGEKGLNYSICRPFNIYGINDFPGKEAGFSHVIPDLIAKTLNSTGEVEIFGDGQQTRCFTHISDLSRAIIMVMEDERAKNEDYNISVKEETKIIDLARKIWALCGRKGEFKAKHLPGFPSDVKKRIADTSKIETMLGWKPEITLDKGLNEVINWMKKSYGK